MVYTTKNTEISSKLELLSGSKISFELGLESYVVHNGVICNAVLKRQC